MDIVTYSSDVIGLAAGFHSTPDIKTEIGVLKCIQHLEPVLSICSAYDCTTGRPGKHFVIDGDNHPLQISEALNLQDEVKNLFRQEDLTQQFSPNTNFS
jgi:hypothetical protein